MDVKRAKDVYIPVDTPFVQPGSYQHQPNIGQLTWFASKLTWRSFWFDSKILFYMNDLIKNLGLLH